MLGRYFLTGALLLVGALGPAACATPTRAAEPVVAAPAGQTLRAISCPSVTVCYAGGDNGTILGTTNGGATWQVQASGTHYPVINLVCPAVRICFANAPPGCESLGAHVPLLHTADGGSSWKETPMPGCSSSISCPGVTTCYAGISPTGPGYPEFVRTADSGGSWQVLARIDPNWLQGSLACPSSTVCNLAYRNALVRSADGGRTWAVQHRLGARACPTIASCPDLDTIACPGQTACYAGGTFYRGSKFMAGAVTTSDGFRTRATRSIRGLHSVTAMSCPATNVCFALGGRYSTVLGGLNFAGDTGRFAVTRDGGASWRVSHLTSPYPFTTLACPSASVCYAAGFLGRLIGTEDGGTRWHDLIPAVFVSGSYSARQSLHTYSRWFTAGKPWQLTVGTAPGPVLGAGGRPLPALSCRSNGTVAVYVRNAANRLVDGPIRIQRRQEADGIVGRSMVRVTGKLRLDVVSHCSNFSVRVDGVKESL